MSSVKRDKFFKGKLEGVNPTRDLMNWYFFGSEENLIELNAAFLKKHPDTQGTFGRYVCSPREFVGHEIIEQHDVKIYRLKKLNRSKSSFLEFKMLLG
jgi:hypothetical protein